MVKSADGIKGRGMVRGLHHMGQRDESPSGGAIDFIEHIGKDRIVGSPEAGKDDIIANYALSGLFEGLEIPIGMEREEKLF